MPQTDGPIAVMRFANTPGPRFCQKHERRHRLYEKRRRDGRQNFVENAWHIQLLWNHIDKEDHVLFMMEAEQRLSPAAQDELAEGFDREREETAKEFTKSTFTPCCTACATIICRKSVGMFGLQCVRHLLANPDFALWVRQN